jgi:hypothetical protein
MAAAVLVVAGMAAAAQAQDEYILRYKHPEAGDAITLHTTSHVVGTLQGLGVGGQKMTQKVQQWMKGECLEVNEDGVATVHLTFERFAMDLNVGGRHVTFDSAAAPSSQPDKEDPAQPAVRKILAGMFSGKGLTATVTSEGRCLKIEGMDEILEGMKDMPGNEQVAKLFKESMTEDALADDWFSNTTWLPKKPVRVGDVWSSERRMKMGPLGEGLAKSRNRLLGVETIEGRRIARIGQTMNMELSPNPAGMGISGAENMKMKIVCLGGTGTRLWDLDRGYVVRAQESSPLELTLEFGSTTQPSAAVKMTQKFNYSTTVEVVGDDVAAKLRTTEKPKPTAVAPGNGTVEMGAPTTQPAAAK